jgi:UDP-GlcNAc:undecaprenyl-phosphate GlcNAc-1-phosphate transferase
MNKLMMAFIVSAALAFAATPIAKHWAEKVGAIDVPKDNRRVHKKPTPLLGGLSIYFACLTGIILFIPLNQKIIGILAGATVIVICGYFDDIRSLSPKTKFLVQIIAAVIAIYCGVRIDRFTNPLVFLNKSEWIELGIFAYPVTALWIVGLTNAFNLIDGLDGLAAGVSTISSVTLLVAAALLGPEQVYIPIMTAIVAGSTLGFLPYNFNPAKIFMGDTGAMFLGYMLSVISAIGVLKSATALAFLVPVLAMGLPILDTIFAMVRRIANGKSMVEADKGHFHHKLIDKGYSQKQAVLTLYSISAILGVGAVAMIESKLKMAYFLVFVVFLLVSMGIKHLGLLQIRGNKNKLDI